MRFYHYPYLTILFITYLSCKQDKKQVNLISYPKTKRLEVVDTFFGVKVHDPYRWLENDTSEETKEWVNVQNHLTINYLKNIPFREKIRKRLNETFKYERVSAPTHEGKYYYYRRNSGLQNQDLIYRRNEETNAEEVFFDPNYYSKEGLISLDEIGFSKDGSLFAALVSEGGTDWGKIIVKDAVTNTVLQDTLSDIKFSGIAWRGNEGFYYSTYNKPTGSRLTAKAESHKLYFHKLGTSQREDAVIWDAEKQQGTITIAEVTEDERFLVIYTYKSSKNKLFIKDLKDRKGKIKAVVDDVENNHYVVTTEGNRLIIYTELNAPNGRLVEVDFSDPRPENWKDLIAESKNVFVPYTGGGKIFAVYTVDVKSQLKQYDMKGNFEKEIGLPEKGIGNILELYGKMEDADIYYTFSSFIQPNTVYKYSIASGKSIVYNKSEVNFEPDKYETKQVFYSSKDGTRIPMFITFKKGTPLNGRNPTILYGYGGFNVSLLPYFKTSMIPWYENGGIYAQPNLRGGGEYGNKWYTAGIRLKKQNVFDDFIAAAEYLVKEKYTSSEYLAVTGVSNGGLLVGAVLTQRPDLMKVALPDVGVMDMLRYQKFTAGANWTYDYGTAEDSKEMFEYLYKYSPLHSIKKGGSYPATFITTADHDDRVVPAHSFKFAARLQEYNQSTNPILISIEKDAGHGGGGLNKIINLYTDQFAFIWYNMKLVPAFKDMKQPLN